MRRVLFSVLVLMTIAAPLGAVACADYTTLGGLDACNRSA